MLCTRVCFLLKLFIHLTFSTYMVHVVQQQHEVNNQLERHAQLGPCKYLLAPDSLSTVFAFLEVLSSLVDMLQGYYDSFGVVVLVVSVAPGIPRNPTRRYQQRQHRVRFPRTTFHMISHDTWNRSWFLAFLKPGIKRFKTFNS